MDQQLAKYEANGNAIEQCYRIDEVKDIRDRMVALAAYAKQAKNVELETKAATTRLYAERRCGELLKNMKARGELREGGSGANQHQELSNESTVAERITLEKLGISRYESSQWQKVAEIPVETFEAALASLKPLSTANIITLCNWKSPDPAAPESLTPEDFYPSGDAGIILEDDGQPVMFSVDRREGPSEFREIDENLETEHECPRCHYVWSGKAAPTRASSSRRRGRCKSCRQTTSNRQEKT